MQNLAPAQEVRRREILQEQKVTDRKAQRPGYRACYWQPLLVRWMRKRSGCRLASGMLPGQGTGLASGRQQNQSLCSHRAGFPSLRALAKDRWYW